jgi:hypothetical protein
MGRGACEGDAATFTVAVGGSEPPSYQCRKDGIDIPGAGADLCRCKQPARTIISGGRLHLPTGRG